MTFLILAMAAVGIWAVGSPLPVLFHRDPLIRYFAWLLLVTGGLAVAGAVALSGVLS